MTPYFHDDWLTIYQGDVRAVLPELASDSVDCIVTSPPYWGLRDYGNDGQLGLERTPEEYVANMVAVFRELRRVLKPSGTCWLNLGDSYAGSGKGGNPEGSAWSGFVGNGSREKAAKAAPPYLGLAQKQLVGIPWRVAFALQADGWYLRSDIIWAKPNPMPESVTDRPTKAHEYLFLLTKSARYFFDADAVREQVSMASDFTPRGPIEEIGQLNPSGLKRQSARLGNGSVGDPTGRNIRSVWTIATRPYPGAHFAVFPPELPERCIKAGSSERGVCPECGAPWERVVERERAHKEVERTRNFGGRTDGYARTKASGGLPPVSITPTGWGPSCRCLANGVGRSSEGAGPREEDLELSDHRLRRGSPMDSGVDRTPLPAVVLDPFAGSGTTGMVANSLSRRAILIDLSADYLKQQLARNAQTPLGLAG